MSAVERAVDEISGIVIGSGYYATQMGVHSAREAAQAVIDSLRADLASGDPERVREAAEVLGLVRESRCRVGYIPQCAELSEVSWRTGWHKEGSDD